MTVQFVTEEELTRYLDAPFNPPLCADEASKTAFGREWHLVRDSVIDALGPLGTGSSCSDSDFDVGSDYTLSRGVSLVLTSSALLSRQLVPAVQAALQAAPHPYSVFVTDWAGTDFFIELQRVILPKHRADLAATLGLNASDHATNVA